MRALAKYRLADDAPLCDLDDFDQLRALGVRPSDVVSRDYDRTRAWALRIYEQGVWVGVRWWSYYDSRWASIGLWKRDSPGARGGPSDSAGRSRAARREPHHRAADH